MTARTLRIGANRSWCALAGWLIALGGCSGGSSSPSLQLISITPAAATAAAGNTAQFSATARYSDGSQTSVTTDSSWSSSDSSIAAVGAATGTAQAEAMGTAIITAAYQGMSDPATLTVTAPALSSVEVTPATTSTPLGVPVSFKAVGTYSDHSTR